LILQQERHFGLNSGENINNGLAFMASRVTFGPRSSFSPNFTDKGVFPKRFLNNNRPICTFCHLPGHIEDKCFKKHDFSPGYQSRWKLDQKRANHIATGFSHEDNSNDTENVDFGYGASVDFILPAPVHAAEIANP